VIFKVCFCHERLVVRLVVSNNIIGWFTVDVMDVMRWLMYSTFTLWAVFSNLVSVCLIVSVRMRDSMSPSLSLSL